MDRHILWLRRHVITTVVTRSVRLFVAAFVVVCLVALVRGGLRIETSGSVDGGLLGFSAKGSLGSRPLGYVDVGAAFLLAQLVAGARLLIAIEANPLNRRYLKRYGDRALRFRPIDLSEPPHGVVAGLAGFGLERSAAIGDLEGDESMVFDLFTSANRLVIVAAARATGSVSVLSELDDGRLVVTSAVTMVPNERLVVNSSPGASLPQLLGSHRNLLESLIGRRARPVPSSPEVFVRSLHIEQQSFQALGPIVGSFCDLLGKRRAARLMVRLDPAALRALSFDDGPAPLPPLRFVSFEPAGSSAT